MPGPDERMSSIRLIREALVDGHTVPEGTIILLRPDAAADLVEKGEAEYLSRPARKLKALFRP